MEEYQEHTSFTFEIDNFSEKEGLVESPKFSSGGCEWYVGVFPKGANVDDHVSMYLYVANPESLRLGWKRRATSSFFLLNPSGKEFFRIAAPSCQLFCDQFPGWGNDKLVPLKELQEKGFLENNKLIVKVKVKVVEVVDQGDVTGNETLDFEGFQILYSQVVRVSDLFAEHPDIAMNVRPKNQLVKATYMNLLLGLIETLDRPPHSITDTELSNAQSEFIELTGAAGFKLDWLKTKLDDISLERKKANADGSRVRQLEGQIKNLKAELDEEKVKSAAKDLSLEKTVSELKDELNKEKSKYDTCAAKVLWLEHTVSNLKAKQNKKPKLSPH
ncbi:unnamed protein product [Microthlaspi erraticum]|uniref:MATH domain-containing protein n=1 Tax=Microthlaspi erraticum TaxID=1685480 RepID=A0A6D2K0A3_9BRAS|nr:unnamed protein product [Microthlaspi erraticum]